MLITVFVDSEYCEGDGPRVFAVHYTKAQFRNPGGVSEMEHDSSRSGYHEPERICRAVCH